MRIIVTGSRELEHPETVHSVLSRFAPARKIIVVVGFDPVTQKPRGTDKFAWEWAADVDRPWAEPECFPAHWEKPCQHAGAECLTSYCLLAGMLRNQQMVNSGGDYALAFFKRGAKNAGTRDCLRRVRHAGIKFEKHWEAA